MEFVTTKEFISIKDKSKGYKILKSLNNYKYLCICFWKFWIKSSNMQSIWTTNIFKETKYFSDFKQRKPSTLTKIMIRHWKSIKYCKITKANKDPKWLTYDSLSSAGNENNCFLSHTFKTKKDKIF